MALAWKRKNRRGSFGVLTGTEVAVGWAFRAESVALEQQISHWLLGKKSSRRYRHWFQTHYAQGSLRPANYSISTIDSWAQKWADPTGLYDAPLVLAVAYRESRFKRSVVSPAGAVGLMQLMPRTGKKFVPKGTDLYHPEGNLRAGINYLHFLDKFWADRQVPAPDRLYFVLASYNTGPAPVVRAHKRARIKGLDPARWYGNVETVLRSPGRRYAREIAEIADVYRNYWRLNATPQPEGFNPPVPSLKTGSK
jgi:membrane-bound lytic murein transglycosylase F